MSKLTNRSKDRPSDNAHIAEHTSTETHGVPARFSRAKTRGKSPSRANAAGSLEYERHKALYIPNALTAPPMTTATARATPPQSRATSTHAPVLQLEGSTWATRMAAIGTT